VARSVYPYLPTWLDRHFRKAFALLPAGDQEDCEQRLADLVAALRACSHPAMDPQLRPWRPSHYRGVTKLREGHLVEYRFMPGTMRVIACYFDHDDRILLVTATLTHDHGRMQRLIKEHGKALSMYGPDDEPSEG
jgi:hypothetical protein